MANKLFELLKDIFSYEARTSKKIAEFAHEHKNLLIIIADPKTDKLFCSYNDRFAYNQIKSADGKKTHAVKGALSHSLFKKEIDNFLVSIMDTMKLSLKDGNLIYQWLDGALFNIAKRLRINRVEKQNKSNQPNAPVSKDYSNPSIPVV